MSAWKAKLFDKKPCLPCYLCGQKLCKADATVDHVKPQSKGGYDKARNFAICCAPCNGKKSDSYPYEGKNK